MVSAGAVPQVRQQSMIRANREEYEKLNPCSISPECRVRGDSRSAGESGDLSRELTGFKIGDD
jgi:hypothetical protein